MAETMKKMAAAALAACALCLALVPGIAWAAVDPEAVVEGAGDGAAVSLKLPDGARDDVRTPVSYTHLDVYKRQTMRAASPSSKKRARG